MCQSVSLLKTVGKMGHTKKQCVTVEKMGHT